MPPPPISKPYHKSIIAVALWEFATLLVIGSTLLPPGDFPWAGLLGYTFPAWLLVNLLGLALLFYQQHFRAGFFLILAFLLLGGGNQLNAVFKLPHFTESKQGIAVLNYNVRVFNRYDDLHETPSEISDFIEAVNQTEADIKCLQEFYHHPKEPHLNSVGTLSQEGKYHHFVAPFRLNRVNAIFGLAIFSRFPIVKKQTLFNGNNGGNGAIAADLHLTDTGDTIRVFNVHLQSIALDQNGLIERIWSPESWPAIVRSLHLGWSLRQKQVDQLMQAIQQSPYPVLVCGDFNDLPFSYTYRKLRATLQNAFEGAGTGFGVTHQSELPLLRIDHQFYSDRFQITGFETLTNYPYSDHFPLRGYYQLRH